MSKLTVKGDVAGTGVFTVASPNSNTDRTLTLPDESGTVLTDRVIAVAASAPDDSLVVNSAGNVGVGTSSPGARLTVEGGWAQVTNGSSSMYVGDGVSLVSGSPDSASAIRFDGDALLFSNSNLERMRIDTAGRVTMPYQPAFHAVLNGAQTMVNNTDFVFGTAFLNRGSHYSTSTGRFTAPVTGVYFIHFEGLSAASERDQLDIRFFINGNQSQVATTYQVDYGGTYRKVAMTAVVSLSANDYIAIRTQSPSNCDFYGITGATIFATSGGGHTGFKGFLVG